MPFHPSEVTATSCIIGLSVTNSAIKFHDPGPAKLAPENVVHTTCIPSWVFTPVADEPLQPIDIRLIQVSDHIPNVLPASRSLHKLHGQLSPSQALRSCGDTRGLPPLDGGARGVLPTGQVPEVPPLPTIIVPVLHYVKESLPGLNIEQATLAFVFCEAGKLFVVDEIAAKSHVVPTMLG
jgi:hypothetical protein